jgi:hypothetical protein
MDPEILKDIVAEIWPGYEAEDDPRRNRMEIKGYLRDYLDSYEKSTSKREAVSSGPDVTGTPA